MFMSRCFHYFLWTVVTQVTKTLWMCVLDDCQPLPRYPLAEMPVRTLAHGDHPEGPWCLCVRHKNFIHRFSWICDKMSSMSRMKHDKNLFMAFFATTAGKLRSCQWFHGVSAGGGLIHQMFNSICTFNLYHGWFQRPTWTWAFLLVSLFVHYSNVFIFISISILLSYSNTEINCQSYYSSPLGGKIGRWAEAILSIFWQATNWNTKR